MRNIHSTHQQQQHQQQHHYHHHPAFVKDRLTHLPPNWTIAMSLIPELALGVAFTMIALAPMVPDWIKGNPQPQTKVQVMTGLVALNGQTADEREAAYKEAPGDMGGCVPHIGLFNANGDRVAFYKNDGCKNHMDHNEPYDIMANYFKKGSELVVLSNLQPFES
jgi:hypothetical protein